MSISRLVTMSTNIYLSLGSLTREDGEAVRKRQLCYSREGENKEAKRCEQAVGRILVYLLFVP